MISADELKNTIILAAKGMNLIDDASFQSTLDIKGNIPSAMMALLPLINPKWNQTHSYFKNNGPKLEGYDMPTADPVNYLNAGGSFGGTYAQ